MDFAGMFGDLVTFFGESIRAIIDFVLDILWSFLDFLIHLLFGWINIPQMPEEFVSSVDSFLDLVFGNLSLLGFFIRPTTLRIAIPLFLVIINFKYIYKFIMWIVHKIPFIHMS